MWSRQSRINYMIWLPPTAADPASRLDPCGDLGWLQAGELGLLENEVAGTKGQVHGKKTHIMEDKVLVGKFRGRFCEVSWTFGYRNGK